MSRILVPRFDRAVRRTWYVVPVALVLASGVAHGATDPKVTICHLPPGDPGNVQLMTVGAAAVPAHKAQHGDAVCAPCDSDCCVLQGGVVCTNLQDDADNCGSCCNACSAGQVCTSGVCVTSANSFGCPFITAPREGGCFWLDCFDFDGNCCWVPSLGTVAQCQELDGCDAGGGNASGGDCYRWASCSLCPSVFPPWP